MAGVLVYDSSNLKPAKNAWDAKMKECRATGFVGVAWYDVGLLRLLRGGRSLVIYDALVDILAVCFHGT